MELEKIGNRDLRIFKKVGFLEEPLTATTDSNLFISFFFILKKGVHKAIDCFPQGT